MPLMIGSDAAFSLPCWGSSMAKFTVPLVAPPPPPLAAGVLLHAENASAATAASTPSVLSFIQLLLLEIDRPVPGRSPVELPASSKAGSPIRRSLPVSGSLSGGASTRGRDRGGTLVRCTRQPQIARRLRTARR